MEFIACPKSRAAPTDIPLNMPFITIVLLFVSFSIAVKPFLMFALSVPVTTPVSAIRPTNLDPPGPWLVAISRASPCTLFLCSDTFILAALT